MLQHAHLFKLHVPSETIASRSKPHHYPAEQQGGRAIKQACFGMLTL